MPEQPRRIPGPAKRDPFTQDYARKACFGCPFPRMLCRERGMSIKGDNIWGGAVLKAGKIRDDNDLDDDEDEELIAA